MKYTIIGSRGFIGKEITSFLTSQGHECFTPESRLIELEGKELNNIIYAAGVPDFMTRPFDAIEAHVCQLKKILENSNFESLIYLSGTRVYWKSENTKEDQNLVFNPHDKNDLYGMSKMMAENLCMFSDNPNIRILRLSNVTGKSYFSHLFLPSIIKDAIFKNKIKVYTTLSSKKDYVYIDDVLNLIPKITEKAKDRIYNVASGLNIESGEIIEKISQITGCQVEVSEDAKEYSFPEVNIEKIKKEFNYEPTNILNKLDYLIQEFKKKFGKV